MLKVLIVEDEFLVRVGLRSLIDWSGNGFELLEDATDGEQAMQRIRECLPDIILLDIQLPKMNGLQVLRELRALKIQAKVVVISCNDEFEAVKQAMANGAIDYLRKLELNQDDLINVLLKIKESICQPGEPAAETSGSPKHSDADWIDVVIGERETLPKSAALRSGLAMFLDVDEPDEHFYALDYSVFLNVVRQSLYAYGIACVAFRSGPSTFCTLFQSGFSPETLAQKVQAQLQQTIGVDCSIGLGPKWMDAPSLRASVMAAKRISYYKFYYGKNIVQSFSSAEEPDDTGEGREKRWSLLLDAVHFADRERLCTVLADIWTDIVEPRTLYPDRLKILCIRLLGKVQEALDLQEKDARDSDFQAIMSAQTVDRVKEYLFFRVEEMYQSAQKIPPAHYSRLIINAIEYIDSHITQPISLSRVAKEISVSESYFSMLFKKEVGENCIAYINRKKVDTAKAMLNNDMLIYEVAESLGYYNSNYF